jgi:protein-disulfide isomerase
VKTSLNTRISIVFTAVMVLAILVLLAIGLVQSAQSRSSSASDPSGPAASAVGDDSHRLDSVPGSAVTVVEFLDFECESCAAAYPMVQSVREQFAGQITFVVRYFPIPSHHNSTNAAIAVEAAAGQGRFEQMYSRMFETQSEWGEQQESRAPLFRQFAEEIGLDMELYDDAVADPATAERVASDFDDGRELGVQSTPSFFVNDRLLRLTSFDDLRIAIEAELGR